MYICDVGIIFIV